MEKLGRLAALVPKLKTPLQLVGWIVLIVPLLLAVYGDPRQIHLVVGVGLVGIAFLVASLPYFFLENFPSKQRLRLVLANTSLAIALLLVGLVLTGWFLIQLVTAKATAPDVGINDTKGTINTGLMLTEFSGKSPPPSDQPHSVSDQKLAQSQTPNELPPIDEGGAALDEAIKRVEGRLFRVPTQQNSDSPSTDSPVITIAGQFDGWLNNERTNEGAPGTAITFALSNPGEGILFVDKIWLTVADSDKCLLYSFPLGLRMPLKPIEYEVTLDSNTAECVVTEDKFKYNKGEADLFSVQVKSQEGRWYRVKVNARWFREGESGQKKIATTTDYLIAFPRTTDFKSLLANAKKLDIQVNTLALSDVPRTPESCSGRILVPGASYFRPVLFEASSLSQWEGNVRPTGEGVKWCHPTCSGCDFQRLMHQFIIIDDSVVLCNYQDVYGLLLRDPSEVKPFRDSFEANWNRPLSFQTADEMVSALLDRGKPPELRASAAYNLRHFVSSKGFASLADSVNDPSEKVSRAAKSSLEVFGAAEKAEMRFAVANIVLAKCRTQPSVLNPSVVEWMEKYVARVRNGSGIGAENRH